MGVVGGLCPSVVALITCVSPFVVGGALIAIVFGIYCNYAVVIVAALMTFYGAFGGMLAATWVQIIKAVILLGMVGILAALCVTQAGGLGPLYDAAEVSSQGKQLFGFGGLQLGLFGAISLALTQIFGMMGMPHLLIRFFTVPDARAARHSLIIGTTIIGQIGRAHV